MKSTLIRNLKKISSSPGSYSDAFVGQIAEEAIEELERLNSLIPEWQPISTAPKDVKRFIAYDKDFDVYACFRSKKMWLTGDYDCAECYPTHWIPLPEPPNE